MVWVVGLGVLLFGCSRSLPDPDSPGARLYRQRCGSCHPLHTPSTMTAAMWEYQVEQRPVHIMTREGRPLLTPREREVLLTYLRRHSAGR